MAAIKTVGVIGSGQMGNGIAHVAALAGFNVVLYDVSADRLKSAMATINGNLSRQVAKKTITEDAHKKALTRITSSDSLDGLAACDLVIETAVEKEEVKRKADAMVQKRLDQAATAKAARMLAVMIGGALAGLFGMLIAIPSAACIKILSRQVILPRLRAMAGSEPRGT